MNIKKYILQRSTNTTAWIGVIGLALIMFRLDGLMFLLFLALIVLPEATFAGRAKAMSGKLHQKLDDKPRGFQ